jgi:cation transport ATPase
VIKETLFKQTWWVTLTVILAVLQIVFAVGIGLDSEATATERLVIFSIWGGTAVLALVGVQKRRRSRRTGDTLIAVGVIPALISGIIFFWFPPMWLTTAAALAVIVFSIRDAMNPVAAATT